MMYTDLDITLGLDNIPIIMLLGFDKYYVAETLQKKQKQIIYL